MIEGLWILEMIKFDTYGGTIINFPCLGESYEWRLDCDWGKHELELEICVGDEESSTSGEEMAVNSFTDCFFFTTDVSCRRFRELRVRVESRVSIVVCWSNSLFPIPYSSTLINTPIFISFPFPTNIAYWKQWTRFRVYKVFIGKFLTAKFAVLTIRNNRFLLRMDRNSIRIFWWHCNCFTPNNNIQ